MPKTFKKFCCINDVCSYVVKKKKKKNLEARRLLHDVRIYGSIDRVVIDVFSLIF